MFFLQNHSLTSNLVFGSIDFIEAEKFRQELIGNRNC